jgi:hypothetical protein
MQVTKLVTVFETYTNEEAALRSLRQEEVGRPARAVAEPVASSLPGYAGLGPRERTRAPFSQLAFCSAARRSNVAPKARAPKYAGARCIKSVYPIAG